ncbi:MAG TPA: asparagine synthase (glutamine-hydrolyzing) [Candidatus Acidoferrales bacterium]
MCGICGAIGLESREQGEQAVRRMLQAIIHRGPDAEGFLNASPVVVGSRRLSIIDLPGGSQPIWNETETLAVVYNGEIYNFRELRRELQDLGHSFRTNSDTEVIVHAYEEWGEASAARLHGMFAFAIVEMPQGRSGPATRVFLARDPLGIKPLYYEKTTSSFLFSSEVRSLLASGHVAPQLAADSVSAYLLFGSVCEPMTMVEGVLSLPPGHFITIKTDGRIEAAAPKSYLHLENVAQRKTTRKSGEGRATAAADVRSLLEDAVKSHLIADVPVGVFLSSGVDSTALAALAARVQGGIHTFTVAFPDIEFSEAKIARSTAKRLGTQHSELCLSGSEMADRLDEAVAAFDQPSMDGINSYFVSWAARQAGLKVALSGLGSDEIFGGYNSFGATGQVARIARAARLVPRPVRGLGANLMKKSKAYRGSRDAFRKASAAWLDPGDFPHPYFFTRALFTASTVAGVLGQEASSWSDTRWGRWLAEAAAEAAPMDNFTQVSWLELRSYMLNTLLRDTDAMSMHHSLEVRVPFLDRSLVEQVLGLPEAVKKNPAKPKSLLLKALGDLLPREITSQKKRTFTFPWENWLRGKLGERVAAGLQDWSPHLESHLNGRFAGSVFKDFQRGRTTWSRPWSLYVLNEWVKRNLRVERPAETRIAQNPAVPEAGTKT